MAESRSSTVPTEDPSNVSAQLGESGGDRLDRGRQTMLGDEPTILTTNIRGLRQGRGELGAMAVERGRPHFLCLTETHLDTEPDASIAPQDILSRRG